LVKIWIDVIDAGTTGMSLVLITMMVGVKTSTMKILNTVMTNLITALNSMKSIAMNAMVIVDA
jgi:hypothetical protein